MALRELPEIILEDGKRLAGREGWGNPAECDDCRAWQDLVYFGSMLLERLYRICLLNPHGHCRLTISKGSVEVPSPDPSDESNRHWRIINGLLA